MQQYEKGYKELNAKKINFEMIFVALFVGMVLTLLIDLAAVYLK